MTDFYKNNDDQIRDKLTEHEFSQVSGAWDNMSKLLDQQHTVPKAAGAWWWSLPLVAAAVLTGIISVGVYLNKDQTTTQTLATQEQDEKPEVTVIREMQLNASDNTDNQNIGNKTTDENGNQQNSNLLAANENNAVATNEISTNTTKKVSQKSTKQSKTHLKQTNSTANSDQNTTANSANFNNSLNTNTTIGVDNNNILAANNQPIDNQAVENAVDNAEGNNGNKRVKTTRTIVSYQYSMTPLMELQAKGKLLKEPEPTIGNFGINEEWTTRRSPVKIGVFAGASAKMYGATKKMSVMPAAGVTVSYKVAPRHGIQAGLQYKAMSQLPSSQNNESSTLNYQSGQNTYQSYAITRIDMLEMPLVYQFYAHQKFNVQAGVKASWLFNAETTNPDFNNLTNEELGIANFDFGVLVGLEYLFNKHLSLALQYHVGFLNLTASGQIKQEQAMQHDAMIGIDAQEKANALSTSGEIIVPVSSDATHQEILRLPSNLHNNDIQLLLKYTF